MQLRATGRVQTLGCSSEDTASTHVGHILPTELPGTPVFLFIEGKRNKAIQPDVVINIT